MKKLIIPFALLASSAITSLFFIGPTLTTLQMLCLGIGFICLLSTHTLCTLRFNLYPILLIAGLMSALAVGAEVIFIQYIQNIIQNPIRLFKAVERFWNHRNFSHYLIYVLLFVVQTILVLILAKGSLRKKIITSIASFIITVIIIRLIWAYAIDLSTKAKYVTYIVDELLRIYTNIADTKEYQAFDAIRERLTELRP